MGSGWNFCVICLSPLGKRKAVQIEDGGEDHSQLVANKEGRSTTIKFLLQNLLTTRTKTYGQVVKDVLKLAGVIINEDNGVADGRSPEVKTEVEDKNTEDKVGGNMGGGSGSDSEDHCLQICDNCEGTAGRILDLHVKLEKLQQRLRREVKAVQEAIVRSSGWLGGINGGGQEAFDNFSRKFWNGEEGKSSKAKETFEILKAFQTAVNESDDYELILGFPANVDDPLEEPVTSEDSYLGGQLINDDIVKTELPDDESDSLAGSLHLGDFLDEYVDNPNGNFAHSLNLTEPPAWSDSAKTSSLSIEAAEPSHVMTKLREKAPPAPCSSKTAKRLYTHHQKSKSTTFSRKKLSPKKMKRLTKPKKSKKSKVSRGRSPTEPQEIPAATVRRVGKNFICDNCGYSSRYASTLEQHLRGHEADKKSFHCSFPQCTQSFTTKQYHDFHEDQHKGHHKLPCDVCHRWFSKFDLPAHIKTHVETVVPCPQCSRCFSSLDAQLLHLQKIHFGKDLKCFICGIMFQKKEKLLLHLHEVHEAIPNFQCDFEGCDKSFLSQISLTRHKISHTDQIVCKICYKRFTTVGALGIHQRLHTSERPYHCDQCPETFNSKQRLKNHMVRMHGAEKFKCPTCAKEYGSQEGLIFHKKMEHSETIKRCSICNKKLVSEHRRRIHMEQHSSDRKYMCDVCGKSFLTSNACNQHKRIHGEKNHICPHCNKSFTKLQYLGLHLRTHTGEKPYSCDRCGKSFSQRGSVLVHQRKCLPPAGNANDV